MWNKKKLILSVLIYLIIIIAIFFLAFILGVSPIILPALIFILSIFWFRHLCDFAWESESEEDELRITRRKRAGIVMFCTLALLYPIPFVMPDNIFLNIYTTYGKLPFMVLATVIIIIALYYFAFIPNEGDEKTWKNFFSTFFKKGYM